MNKLQLEGKTLTVILLGTDEKGKDEVFVYKSKIRKQDEEYTFEIPSNIYENNSDRIILPLDEDFLERLKPVGAEMKETLSDADYSLALTIGNLSDEK